MYEKFYSLKNRPFNQTADPDYFFPGRCHKNALDFLYNQVGKNNGEIIVLTGDLGSGKTILLRRFLKDLPVSFRPLHVPYSVSSSSQLFDMILLSMGDESDHDDLDLMRDRLKNNLIDIQRADKTAMLLIDEAQNLDNDAIEEIVNLSKLRSDNGYLIKVMLIGLPDLHKKLERTGAPDSSVTFHLKRLEADEVDRYIDHHFRISGRSDAAIIPDDVISEITELSGGIPRIINKICDLLLLEGYLSENKKITLQVFRDLIESEFYDWGIDLPAADKEQQPLEQRLQKDAFSREHAPGPKKDLAGTLSLRVLLLEKNAPLRVHLENRLKQSGYTVVSVLSTAALFDAIEKSDADEFRIIVADAAFFYEEGSRMTNKGRKALEKIYKHYTFLPVVITSNLPLTSIRESLVKKGMPYLIYKPLPGDIDFVDLSMRLDAFSGDLIGALDNIRSQFGSFFNRYLKVLP